jgi:hypothetical protein
MRPYIGSLPHHFETNKILIFSHKKNLLSFTSRNSRVPSHDLKEKLDEKERHYRASFQIGLEGS